MVNKNIDCWQETVSANEGVTDLYASRKRLKTETPSLCPFLTLEPKTPNSHQLHAAIVQLCEDEEVRSENQV